MSGVLATLPRSGDSQTWNDQERALVKAAGLVRTEGRGSAAQEFLADRPTVEAFLAHCQRTGLDPIARQIYAIYRGGKWGIQLSIDGFRLVAERSGLYEGQEDAEFSNDGGQTWTTAWMPTADQPYPTHARVGVFKKGHRQALRAVARWDSYVVTKDEWSGREKTGRKIVSDMWAKMPDTMLSKVAEMLALRKAFPQDLGGLYGTEEMQQAGQPASGAQRPVEAPVVAAPTPTRDWLAEAGEAQTMEALTAVAEAAQQAGQLGVRVGLAGDNDDGTAYTVMQVLQARRAELLEASQPEPLVDEPEPAGARDWLGEARPMTTVAAVKAHLQEASAKGATDAELAGISDLAADLERQMAAGSGWAGAGESEPQWVAPGEGLKRAEEER